MSTGEGAGKVERETRATSIESALVSLGTSVENLETFLNDANGEDMGKDDAPNPSRAIVALIDQLPVDLLSLKDKINSLVTKCREAFL